jgi:asparagine synthase (glutamine-hydrolysing)
MGPDDEQFAYSASIGMSYRPFHTDRESRLTAQPIVTSDGYMLSFEGRLDNAGEMRRSLREHATADSRSVDLVIAAYRRWGIEAFARLIGDFALALWDAGDQCLFLCTDALGRRPLYYHVTPEYVFWSSRSRPLLDATGLHRELDEEYIADFLTNRPSARSPFTGIELVSGGHVLVANRAKAALKRYWSFDPGRRITYRSDEDYENHFTELFREAVACRMRAERPVFCELSGGVDSSSIVCVADRLSRSGEVETPGIHTVSFVFDGSATSDERPYIEAVEKHINRPGLHISEEQCPLLKPLPDLFAPDLPTPRLCFLAREDRLAREMQKLESRVLLSGIGGDQMFWSQPPDGLPLADLLVRGHMVELFRSCAEWSRLLRSPFLKTLWVGACQPLLPRRWDALTRQGNPLPNWVNESFAKRTDLRKRALPVTDDLKFSLPSSSAQYGLILKSMRTYSLERCSSEGYVDARYPYLDRRLIEFALAIPLEQKLRPRESRSIVRRAFRGVLPEAVRQRRTKAGPGEAFSRALIREWSRLAPLLSDPRIAAHGFVDRDAFRTDLHRARHGLAENQVHLIKAISLEFWLRTLEDRPRKGDTVPPGWRRNLHHGGTHVERADLRTA